MKKPTLALLTLDFYPRRGGQQEFLFEIAQRLAAHYRVVVLTPVEGEIERAVDFERVILESTHPGSLWRQLRRMRPQQILLGHAHPRLLLAAWLLGQSFALLAHGNDFLAAQLHWHRPLFNWLLAKARPLMVNSQSNAARLAALGCQQVQVVYPGTDPQRFSPAAEPPAAPVLLTVTRLVSRKGIDTVLRSLPALLAKYPHVRYQIAGQGPDRERLESLALELGVRPAVDFLGFVPDEQLPQLYHQATLFVMPAREEPQVGSVEGFGIVYLEASASGLPVVAGRSGGAIEAVKEEETGLLVPPDDPQALQQALERLLADPGLCRQLGAAGRRWVETEMNWDRAARQVHRLFER